ncbi:MAG: hypothetical protein ACE1S7_04845, partial [Candidatus Tisiphia sp.]
MKTTTIFILLFIISVTNKIYASSWLIDSGKYKYTVTARVYRHEILAHISNPLRQRPAMYDFV